MNEPAESRAAAVDAPGLARSGHATRGGATGAALLQGRYALEELIGQGRVAHVFRARDLQRRDCIDGELVEAAPIAVKLLRPEWQSDVDAVQALQREFRHMRSLAHPGVARVLYLGRDGIAWFMTMELIRGRTAAAWMDESHSRSDALRVIHACGRTLEHAHARGIVHGNLEPGNIMIEPDGTVRLIDFGANPNAFPAGGAAESIAAESVAAESGAAGSSALYASPQLLAGHDAGICDDVFSLACLSYALLTGGRHPFGRRPMLEHGRIKVGPVRVKTLPPELFEVIEHALAADAGERPQTVDAYLRRLQEAAERLQAEVISADVAAPLPHAPGASAITNAARRKRWRAVPLAAAAAAVLAGTAWLHAYLHEVPRAPAQPVQAAQTMKAVQPVQALQPAATTLQSTAAVPLPAAPHGEPGDAGPRAEAPAQNAGLVSFETRTLRASPRQPVIALSVRRLHGQRGPAAFRWQLEGDAAHAGIDFSRLQSRLVRFQDGQTVRTLFIPLRPLRATERTGPRRFTVSLQPVAGGPSIGRIPRVTVVIDAPPAMLHPALFQANARF